MTNEQIAELADKIQAECINWPDRFFDHDEAERLIRSALAAPATQEEAESYWWCPECQQRCEWNTVTFEEYHAVCGTKVQMKSAPDPAPPAREDRTKAHRWTNGPIVTCLDCGRHLSDETRDRACIPPTPASAPEETNDAH